MKIKFFDNAGPVDFWRPDWEDNSSSTLLETDSALLDWTSGIGLGFDEKMFIVEFFDYAEVDYKYAGFVWTETNFPKRYNFEGVAIVEKTLFGNNFSELYVISDLDYSATSYEGMFLQLYIAIYDFNFLTSGDDTIEGNNYGNILDGGRGDDTIYGNGGNDFLDGQWGNNVMYGGSGNDRIYWGLGENNVDIAYGGTGIDSLYDPGGGSYFIRGIDVFGIYFAPGTEYIRGKQDDGSIIRASSIEKIDNTSVDSYTNWGTFLVYQDSQIPNKNYSISNRNYSIELDDYLSTINYGMTTHFEYSLSNEAYRDQFNLNGDTLTINNGSGTTRTVNVTVTAKNKLSNGTIRNETGKSDTFTVTFKDNNNTSTTYSGTSGNDTRTLSSGNDTWEVGKGSDKINGGSGSDTLLIPFGGTTAQGTYITKGLDVKGSYTGIINQTFIYIYNEDQGGTTAWNFEKIRYFDLSRNISTFEDTGRWDVQSTRIPDKTVSNNSTSNINLNDYFWSINAATTNITYTIQSSNNVNLEDQITLSGSNLRLESGSQGDMQTIEITIRGKQNFSDDWQFTSDDYNYNDETFTVTMRDNNVSGTSGDDTITLTSDNDTYTATFGVDRIDGGAGTDTIIVPDDARVTRSTDVKGWSNRTGIKGKDFLFIQLKDDEGEVSGSTVAWNFEKIQKGVVTSNISSFDDNGNWDVGSSAINNISPSSLSSENINLNDYFWTQNEGATLSYTISISGDEIKDQITLNGSTITFQPGSSGIDYSANVTVRATQSYPSWDGKSNNDFDWDELSFKVTMRDDDYVAPENYSFSSTLSSSSANLSHYSSNFNSSDTQNYTSSNDIIVLTGQSATLRGNNGDDIYFLSNLLPNNSKTEIVDQTGNNIIQIPDNTLIKEVIFASDAVRITFDSNKVVTVNDAANFNFELSGNISSGDTPVQFSYSEFAELFGVSSPITSNITKSGNYYTKSDASNLNNDIVNINESSAITLNGTSSSDEFRYEFSIVNEKTLSNEGNYEITIDNFDVNDDKIVFVNKGGNNLSISQFKALSGLEISGNSFDNKTGFYFAPDTTGSSGTLIINNIYDSDLEEINVEILSEDNLVNTANNTAGYELSSSINSSKSILENFNVSVLSGTLNSSEYDEIIILTGGAKTYKGNEGDDTYFISNLLPKNSKSDIVDQVGNNIIQFPDNTFIDSILFTKDAIRVTLDDNREITINDADDFIYNLGGNSMEGDPGQTLSFVELASAFGIDNVISLSSSESGTSDIYII